MWLCFNDGFLSAVADKNDPTRLMVRARRKKDLRNVFGDVEIIKNAGTDYRWRTFVDRRAFAALVAARVEKINYPNFKNSVEDQDLHDLYLDFWTMHSRYQQQDLTEGSPSNRKTK